MKKLLKECEYGTLAISSNNKPYSLPINFVMVDEIFYFHGSKKGRKIDILSNNPNASFSVLKAYSLVDSDFSSTNGLACPATQFFRSIIIDGVIEFVDDYDEKVLALSALMSKLQPKGGYKPLNEHDYKKSINATTIYKLIPQDINQKLKFGQHLPQERFDMILENLETRSDSLDLETINMMKKLRKDNDI